MLADLVKPVIDGEADVTIEFSKMVVLRLILLKNCSFLSGQRAIRIDILQNIPDIEVSRYGVEVAINRYIRKNGVRVKLVKLPGLTQVMKEEKLGLIKGLRERMKMYWDIIKNFYRGGDK